MTAITSGTIEQLRALARCARILAMEGHGDMTLGHVSLRDPEGRGFWMKRSGIGLSEVAGSDDFLLLGWDGAVLQGSGARHIEWPIHGEILRRRPDILCVGHSHPFHATTFAATRQPLAAVAHEAVLLGPAVPYFVETSCLIDSVALGGALADTLGDALVVLMANHGVTFCADKIGDLAVIGAAVEKACKAQLMLTASGLPWQPSAGSDLDLKRRQIASPRLMEGFWQYYNRELDRREGTHR